MDNIAQWLASITWPIVSRVLAAVGLGTVTYAGAGAAVNSALDASKSAIAGMSADLIQIMAMAGFFDVMSILSGGFVSGLAWLVMKHFALQTSGSVTT